MHDKNHKTENYPHLFFILGNLIFSKQGETSHLQDGEQGVKDQWGDSHINLPEITGIIDLSEITCLVFVLMKMSAVFLLCSFNNISQYRLTCK